MSRENVEVVRAMLASGVGSDKDALLATLPQLIERMCDPNIEWCEDPGRADSRVWRGHAGVRESYEQWLETFSEYSFQADEIIDCGENVLVIAREIGQGAASGAAVSSPIHAVLTFRDGKLLRYREFYDLAAAREAAAPG